MTEHATDTDTTTEQQLTTLARRWADAEVGADTATFDDLLDVDFRGVGPLGFVLDREQWLRRFTDGLAITAVTYDGIGVRRHGDLAVLLGTWTQTGTYQQHRSDGRFRYALVVHRPPDRPDAAWTVLGAHVHGPAPGPPPG